MKNQSIKWVIFSFVCALVSIAALFCACEENPDPPSSNELPEIHIHTFGEWREIPATCTVDGSRVRECSVCGEKQTEILKSAGHDWQEVSVKKASCTVDGEAEYECSACGETKTEVLKAEGHVWGEIKVISEATCEKEGLRYAKCLICGEHETEQIIPKTDHKFGEWNRVSSPDCTSAGEEERTCAVCSFSESREVSALGHKFDLKYTIDVQPTAESEGSKSRHCLREGCFAQTDVTPIDKLKAETTFTVKLRTTTGGELPECFPRMDIFGADGESVAYKYAKTAEFTLPTKEYTLTVSGLPKGYTLAKSSYKLSPTDPDLEIRIPASMIMEAPPTDLKYRIGSVIYDMPVQVIGLNPEEDRMATLHELFSGYKAVLLNMYFRNCSACVYEMPAFYEAYYTASPSGKLYGEEVACVMLDQYENTDTIRQFKKQTNFYYSSYKGVKNIPMTMIHDAWLRAYFTRDFINAFPTSVLIDCEGVIVEKHVGIMSVSGFTDMMQRGINRYNAIRDWKISEGLGVENISVLPTEYDMVPAYTVFKRREF